MRCPTLLNAATNSTAEKVDYMYLLALICDTLTSLKASTNSTAEKACQTRKDSCASQGAYSLYVTK